MLLQINKVNLLVFLQYKLSKLIIKHERQIMYDGIRNYGMCTNNANWPVFEKTQ